MPDSINPAGSVISSGLSTSLYEPFASGKLRLLLDSVSGHAIYMLSPEGNVTSWSPGAEKITGYPESDVLGQHFSRFFLEEDRTAGVPGNILSNARERGRTSWEGWRLRKDGTRFLASVSVDSISDAEDHLVGFAEITRDTTEARLAYKALQASEAQFRLLVEGVTGYALFMLGPNGTVTSWNNWAEQIKGYSSGEIIGKHFSRFYTGTDREAGIPAHALQMAASEGRFEAEGWRVRKDGSLFWANAIIVPIRSESGQLAGFVEITQDITESYEARLAIKKAQEQRNRMQRMEALGQLTGGVAHDFNNLLMIIGGFTHTLKKSVGQDPKAARAIEAIGMAVERGQSLTQQLQSFSRQQTLNPTVTRIAERIEAFSKLLGSSNARPVKVVASVSPDVWPVKAVVNELELALLNVTLNARDAMPAGGVITVNARNVHLRLCDTPARLEGDFVAVTIAGEGTGIADDILPKVFDPFFTTKLFSKGSEPGLSEAYGFAHQSGGTVTIESHLGEGTKVTLYFPRAEAEPVAETEKPPRPQALVRGTALLVDDNRDVLELSALYLQELGYQVEAFDNAKPALKAAERHKFELVVSDIVMAGMDGIDLAQAIRARQPDMPIVLVTGYSRVPASVGEQFVLVRKPYQLEDLSRAVRTAIAAASRAPSQSLPH